MTSRSRVHPGLYAVSLLTALLAGSCGGAPAGAAGEPGPSGPDGEYVVLVSFDGMRPDFIDRTETPSFDRVAESGVRAEGLIPGYPSKTFPNHYAIATGLYPSNHGLVDNTFYDPELDATYSIGNRTAVEDGRWYRGEPIWVTAENQGVRTASFFWVGTEAPIRGVQPTYFKYYDETIPYAARVDTVLHWLSLPPERRPRLVMLYFDQPDGIAHRRGPGDAAVDSVVRALDGHLGRLLAGLEDTPVAGRVTVILVSDHGMEAVPRSHVIHPGDHADLDGVRVINTATQAKFYFGGDTARLEEVRRQLTAELPDQVTVYRKAETPERWHYAHGDRIGDLLLVADPGWILRPREWPAWSGGGMHGWDPYHPAMHGIFLAAGPGIRPGAEIAAFENVHIYPFLAELLGLDPTPDLDGRLEMLRPVLRPAGP